MRNQIKQANQINSFSARLCLFSGIQRNSLSGNAGKPSWNNHVSVYSVYILCDLCSSIYIFIAVLHQTSQVLGSRKFSINAVHSLYGSKIHRPTLYLTQFLFRWPCVSESTTRDKWSDPKVKLHSFQSFELWGTIVSKEARSEQTFCSFLYSSRKKSIDWEFRNQGFSSYFFSTIIVWSWKPQDTHRVCVYHNASK